MTKNLGFDTRFSVIAQRLVPCRKGAAMFEFALALPVLLIIFAGGWEIARGLWTYDMLNKGVRDAARYVARLEDPNSADAQTKAFRLVLTGDVDLDQPPRLDHNNITISVGTRVYANDGAGGTFQYRGPDGENTPINVVQVKAEYTFDAPLLGFLGIDDLLTITVAHEERHIRD